MRLFSIFNKLHRLAARGTRTIRYLIVGLTLFGVPSAQKLRHPLVFKSLSFSQIEPKALAARASVYGHVAAISCFFYLGFALRTALGFLPRLFY